MPIDKKFVDFFHIVSSQAALASYKFVGKKDKKAADKAALQETFKNNSSNFLSKIIIEQL